MKFPSLCIFHVLMLLNAVSKLIEHSIKKGASDKNSESKSYRDVQYSGGYSVVQRIS